jgi:hypothetical protein
MLALIRCDMRDSSKHVCTVSRAAFNAVPMVDSALACFMIDIKVLQVVVEINAASTEVPTEKRRVRREYRGDVDMSLTAKGDGQPSLPLVEMCNDSRVELSRHIL